MNYNINIQICFIFFGCLFKFTITHGQTLVYYCNFDKDLVDDCIFNKSEGVFDLSTVSGIRSTYLQPTEPLSDVTSIQLLTSPNNESCILPYNSSTGNWSMYFCEWNLSNKSICPTASGIGHCVIGKYAHFKADIGIFDETYSTNIKTQSNIIHCLDFFYYLTDTSEDTKITVGWKSNETLTTIVEVTVSSENRWQRSQTTYISPSSETNQIWFRMTRNNASLKILTYAIDEIKIFEGPCETIPPTINFFFDTIESDNVTTEESETSPGLTTEDVDTTSTTSVVTTSTTILDTTTTVFETTSTTSVVSTSTTIVDTTTTTTIETTSITDQTKWTTNDDVQTTDMFDTTNEDMNVTTSNTSDTNFTTITSHTESSTFYTTSTSNVSAISSTKNSDLIINLGVPLGLGVPALLVIIGGLLHHYRKGQRRSKALADRTNANEIPMTERNA